MLVTILPLLPLFGEKPLTTSFIPLVLRLLSRFIMICHQYPRVLRAISTLLLGVGVTRVLPSTDVRSVAVLISYWEGTRYHRSCAKTKLKQATAAKTS